MHILPWAINVFGFVGAGGLAMLLRDPPGPCSCESSEAKEGTVVSLLSPCPCGRHRDLHCAQTQFLMDPTLSGVCRIFSCKEAVMLGVVLHSRPHWCKMHSLGYHRAPFYISRSPVQQLGLGGLSTKVNLLKSSVK